jgi:hypothetical protein
MPAITDASTCAKYGGKMINGQCVIEGRNGENFLTLEQVTAMDAVEEIIKTGHFRPKTTYLSFAPITEKLKAFGYGDFYSEPTGEAVLDLESLLKLEDFNELKNQLVNVPMEVLGQFFDENIMPMIPSEKLLNVPEGEQASLPSPKQLSEYEKALADYKAKTGKAVYVKLTPPKPPKPLQNMVTVNGMSVNVETSFAKVLWGGVLDLFKEVNLEYTLDKGISPKDWEEQKYTAYLISKDPQAKKDVETAIQKSIDVSTDPKAVPVLEEYLKLPKLGDEGLEINRQAAIRELLLKKEYDTALAVIKVYQYAIESGLGDGLSKPLPYTVNSSGMMEQEK